MPPKSEKAGRGPPVVYSLDAHREFVTGFRKRKQARRQKAKADMEEAEKQARRDMRQQKRQVVRANRERVMSDHSDSDSDSEEQRPDTNVTTFKGDGHTVVTAVVAPMNVASFHPSSASSPLRPAESPPDQPDASAPSKLHDRSQHRVAVDGAALKKSLGVTKTLRKHGKRRVSYTHAMSKTNRRKRQLTRRREAKDS